jgi:hypothetical protein
MDKKTQQLVDGLESLKNAIQEVSEHVGGTEHTEKYYFDLIDAVIKELQEK